ncbi:protein ZNF365 isoform X2 [Electrophorus electricus]|uniref:protein ZNF365 isoform X2 n=1 Tax=Electrophorus electricus TaxID=8005 RepID=UPI0015D04155|nr:protein ZNF365 isoform X2 [Electrophorus electricus]
MLKVLFDMQQKLCTRNTTLFVENGQACGAGVSAQLQFQCPRCSERDSFHSMAALLAHLEYSHASPAGHDLSLPASRARSHSDRREAHKRATAETRTIKDVCSDTHSSRRGEHELLFSSEPLPPERPAGQQLERPRSPEESPGNEAAPAGSRSLSAPVASVGQRLEGMMRTANSSMERHLLRISSALAQTDTALLCERAHWHHLAQERQEVLQRERALSRQVDAAVMVIATLRQQLSVSEHELKRREQEVKTIQRFLEAAAHHEMCGKVRLRRFIENLLRRIALAERLLEYYQCYQCTPHQHCCTPHPAPTSAEFGPHRTTKSRSTGEQLLREEGQAQGSRSRWQATRTSSGREGHQGWLQRRRSDGYEA